VFYDNRPVFAILGGISDRPWQPIHAFCERQELPCLFPLTGLPDLQTPNLYTVYFNRGLWGEADAMARHASDALGDSLQGTTVVQVFRAGEASERMAQRFRSALREQPAIWLSDLKLPRSPSAANAVTSTTRSLGVLDPTALDNATDVFVWLDCDDSKAFLRTVRDRGTCDLRTTRFYFSGTQLDATPHVDFGLPAKSQLTYAYALHSQKSPDVYRVRRWLQSRRIAANGHERIQLNAYYTCNLAKHALRHVVDHFHRDYFLEWIEHEAESSLNPGVFAELTLGPGQRFASADIQVIDAPE
jgi:hypothetical protein